MYIDEKKINEYLKQIKPPACPLCGNKDWTVSNQVFQALEYHENTLIANGATLPIVPLTCVNCGNTYFINALIAKLIEPQNQENNNGE